jgi:hypothetical protein
MPPTSEVEPSIKSNATEGISNTLSASTSHQLAARWLTSNHKGCFRKDDGEMDENVGL